MRFIPLSVYASPGAPSVKVGQRSMVRAVTTIFLTCLLGASPGFAQGSALGAASRLSTLQPDANALSQAQVDRLLKARAKQGADEDVEPNQHPLPTMAPRVPEKESAIELLLSGRGPADVNSALTQFGYEVFQRPVSTFAPVSNIPVGADYVVGPGDSFTVTMWGRQNDQMAVSVDRDGKIALPEVGVLSVSGMTFGRLQDYLENELKRKFTDFRMHITMGRLRTVMVYAIGEAKTPGSYTLSSLSTVMTALFAVGGPSKNGSLRQIRLMRAGQAPVTIDLYEFLLGGDMSPRRAAPGWRHDLHPADRPSGGRGRQCQTPRHL